MAEGLGRRGWLLHSSPQPAPLLLTVLAAGVQTGMLLGLGDLYPRPGPFAWAWVGLSCFWVLCCATWAAWAVLRVATFGRWGRDLLLTVAVGISSLVMALSAMHYDVFQEHLSPETLGIAIEAVQTDEVSIPAATWWLLALVAAVGFAGSLTLLRLFGRWGALAPWADRVARARVVWLGLGAAFLLVEARWPTGTDAGTRRLRATVPWSWATADDSRAYASYRLESPDGRPVELDTERAAAQYAALRVSAPEIAGYPFTAPRTPNILLIIMESVRADMITPEIAPRLTELAGRCVSPERHYASGAHTTSGLFGLFHGLSMLYYQEYERRPFEPILYSVLRTLGYELSFFYAFSLDYGSLREKFFGEGFDRIVQIPFEDHVKAEAELAERFVADVAARSGERPHFDVLFTYASHWDYYYPPEFEKWKPVAPPDLRLIDVARSSPLRRLAGELKNRQRNSIHYTDHLIGRVLDGLGEAGRLRDTIIVVTGDHGEEFFEPERFGHTFDLNNHMIQVPFLYCPPETDARLTNVTTRYRYGSHEDLVPTLFEHLGVGAPPRPFFTGKSLLGYDPERDFALAALPRKRSMSKMMVAGRDLKVRVRGHGPLVPYAVHDLDDRVVERPDAEDVAALLRWIPTAMSLPDPEVPHE